jgi:hypothetical protein
MGTKSTYGNGLSLDSRSERQLQTQKGGERMNGRDWSMLAGGAALSALVIVTFYEGRDYLAAPQVTRAAARALQPASNEATSNDSVEAPAPAARPSAEAPPASQLERIRAKLRDVQREKGDLEAQLHTLEGELARRGEAVPGGSAAEYQLDREDWKELAEKGRIKYRIPCLSSNGSDWQTSPAQLNELGLSPDDGEALKVAHQRSNARLWQVVRPLCVQAVGDAAVADRLGGENCISLLEQTASAADPLAIYNAKQQVAEVHAGIRPRPEAGQTHGPMFDTYLALTSEADAFEADLGETFGPEEAQRITQSLPCVSTVR